jgi:hypothetical protein
MNSKSKTLSENLPTGGGSLCDCEGGLPKVGGGLPKNGGGLAFSLARGKRKYADWIQREVDGGDAGSETDESEYGEEDYANDQLELGVAYELARDESDSQDAQEMVDFVYDQMSPDREVIARANNLPEGVKGIISDYVVAVDPRVNPELLDWVMNEMAEVIPKELTDPNTARFTRGIMSQTISAEQSKRHWSGRLKTDDDIKNDFREQVLTKKH